MGGGHHSHEPFVIPKPEIYDNFREFPQLKAHEERLAKLKLRDPWIKNYVFLFDKDRPHVVGQVAHLRRLLMPGFKWGVGFSAALIFCEEIYSLATKGHTSWAGHH
ncbi:hypothetical protein WR25_05011 [Diploscapter pachys]|uniref:Uncharacterized protein n=1 Tax=Diploscapter pachys TaxID=2018661 RepID=A0A2A2J4N1_9BILA|nr:hypothetical protein WR25_05011 [Diploscapter pachys]